ncbi:MAG TPA: hypothetical protein VGW40_11230 [Allosphingosinicella sp.]|nr:hypothetical protein [Allosphingosinicella sp.]
MTFRNLVSAFRDAKQAILFALCKLNEVQFSAPWAPRRSRCSGP